MTTVAIDARFAVGERRGIGKGSLELLRSLVELDAPLFYELLVDRDPGALIDARENWRWKRLRPAPYPLWEQIALPRYARGQKPAVLHSTGNTGPVSPLGPTRLVLTVHDMIFLENRRLRSWRQRLGRLYRRRIVPAAVRRAGWIITDADATREQLIARFPTVANHISVIGIPIAESFFTYRPAGRAAPLPTFVAFGGIDPRKNVDRILAAFAAVRAAQPSAQLVLIGTQGQLAGDAAPPGVRVRPYIAEDELLELYACASGLVYPSLSEGFGVPILEATALGVPVITSDRDPMRQLSTEASILVDPENTDAIAAAMTALLRDADHYRALAEHARRRAEPFRPARIAGQVAALYLRLAAVRPAGTVAQ
ncbi:MAG: glycosyltransferase family 4 protein [Candidatus Dormibacteraeota bacterium]|nr:glycosyltransferase family 4 protein [Candidatus Dormibacteraeota bacterium]